MTGTVLVIDDSPEVLAVVAARLRPEGYRTLVASTWELGLDLAADAQPDLILLDVEMPEMSGLDVCRRLKANPRTSSIPVIFLTAHDDVALKVHSFDLGAADYMTKPFHPAELRARVRVALRAKRVHDDLGERARLDGLTGLLNRRELDRILAAELAGRGPRDLSLVLVDLDRFKGLNDSFGHAFGDAVLREVGGLLALSVRAGDFACRYGGEEFALILPATDGNAACEVANRVRTSVRAIPFSPTGQPVTVTASFGVAAVSALPRRESMVEPAALIDAADVALYAAKRQGRDRVVVYPDPDGSVRDTPSRVA